jgi:hypothetical protein
MPLPPSFKVGDTVRVTYDNRTMIGDIVECSDGWIQLKNIVNEDVIFMGQGFACYLTPIEGSSTAPKDGTVWLNEALITSISHPKESRDLLKTRAAASGIQIPDGVSQ